MMMQEHEAEGYLTLKQASERFGYTPDYIGQLIRKGKIEGKQVYANVAWMTTEEAMQAYIAGNTPAAAKPEDATILDRSMDTLFSKQAIPLLTWTLRVLFGFLIVIGLLVFYFLSISIDDRLSKRAEANLAVRIQAELSLAKAQSATPITPLPPVAYGQ